MAPPEDGKLPHYDQVRQCGLWLAVGGRRRAAPGRILVLWSLVITAEQCQATSGTHMRGVKPQGFDHLLNGLCMVTFHEVDQTAVVMCTGIVG